MRPSPRPAVLYSFLESRCHLSELECRRMQGGLLSPVGRRAGHPPAALICAGTNPAVILSTSTMLQRLRDSVARSVIIGKGMTSARLFFGLQGHSTEGVKVPLSLSLSLSLWIVLSLSLFLAHQRLSLVLASTRGECECRYLN